MVSRELSEGISETIDILSHMDKTYIDKIPKKFIEFLENNKTANYISNLDHSKKINEMNVKEKTKDILAIIYLMYWCDNDKKSDYARLVKHNNEKHQQELREKYNPNDLFKNRVQTTVKQKTQEQNNMKLQNVKESFFTKFIKN